MFGFNAMSWSGGIQALRHDPDKGIEELIDSHVDSREQAKDEKDNVLCKFCRKKITSMEKAMVVDGRSRHIFSNPHGFVFEIVCFSEAPGCLKYGVPTTEFTWFPGYAWRFAICGNCRNHLGWQYVSASYDSFFGLIVDNLIHGS